MESFCEDGDQLFFYRAFFTQYVTLCVCGMVWDIEDHRTIDQLDCDGAA